MRVVQVMTRDNIAVAVKLKALPNPGFLTEAAHVNDTAAICSFFSLVLSAVRREFTHSLGSTIRRRQASADADSTRRNGADHESRPSRLLC